MILLVVFEHDIILPCRLGGFLSYFNILYSGCEFKAIFRPMSSESVENLAGL